MHILSQTSIDCDINSTASAKKLVCQCSFIETPSYRTIYRSVSWYTEKHAQEQPKQAEATRTSQQQLVCSSCKLPKSDVAWPMIL